MATATIGELPASKVKSVYRRANGDTYVDGDTYIKLNERFHVKTKLGGDDGKSWVGVGYAEELNPDEVVEVIQ